MAATYPALPLPAGITESYLPSHDLNYHVLTAGEPTKPLILCLHGFPELAFSWRKIMTAIAEQGYYVVAYDQRGYGRTTGWDTREYPSVDLSTFAFARLVRDAIILVNALGYKEVACVLGHDFGAVAASMCAVMRPDIFKSIVIMSHPFAGTPTLPFNTVAAPKPTGPKPNIHKALAGLPEPRKHYKLYYSTPPAASEMDNPKEDLSTFLRGYFHLKSADWKDNDPQPLQALSAPAMAKIPTYYIMPLKASMRETVQAAMKIEDPEKVSKLSSRWMNDDDLAVYVSEYGRNGFQGGLNWYRVASDPKTAKDVEVLAGRKIDIPLLYIAGKKDWGTYQEPGAFERMSSVCTRFKGAHLVEDAGHWIQQEQPSRVIELVSAFLKDIKAESISY